MLFRSKLQLGQAKGNQGFAQLELYVLKADPRPVRFLFRDDVVYKCPRFSFARWGAQVWSLEGLFWGPRRGSCHGGVLSLLQEEWPGVKARLLARLYGPEGRP